MKSKKKSSEGKMDLLEGAGDPALKRRAREILRMVGAKKGDIILDIGCGSGFYIHLLLPTKATIIGCDIDMSLLKKAGSRGLSASGLVQGSVYSLPFRDNAFDKVIASEVLEHLEDEQKALSEIRRVMKKKATLAVSVPNKNYPFCWDPLNKAREALGLGHFHRDRHFLAGIWSMHLRLYSKEELKTVLGENGFVVRESESITHYCFPFSHNIIYLLKKALDSKRTPESLKGSLDKFSKKEKKWPVRVAMGIADWVDGFNDREFNEEQSSVGIVAKAVKK